VVTADHQARVRELERFALQALPSMQLGDGTFCYEIVKDDAKPRGRSLRYTLIVSIGLLRAEAAGREHRFDVAEIKHRVLSELDSPELLPADFGLCLWLDALSGHEAATTILDRLEESLGRAGGLPTLISEHLAWIIIGLLWTSARGEPARVERLLVAALAEELERGRTSGGLLLHRGRGWRRRFPNFAGQIYGLLALAQTARLRDDSRARDAAVRVADRLLELQRPDGGWPWVFDARRGTVVEPYELYSVHQDAMAPMALLELSEITADARYREAALAGLEWVWGRNDLDRPMLDRETGILYRSIRRRRPLDRALLYGNTATALLGRSALCRYRGLLELNPTDRPYHLGWVLAAWSGRGS
jgi:hypothetical protein